MTHFDDKVTQTDLRGLVDFQEVISAMWIEILTVIHLN